MTTTEIDLPDSFLSKMREAGLGEAAIACFAEGYRALVRKETGMMPEETISSVSSLPSEADIGDTVAEKDLSSLLGETVVIKLNGGLGTGMGLECAKSLLRVKDKETFLDLIARQILHSRREDGAGSLRFLLMNSFSTSADTLKFLESYAQEGLGNPTDLEFMQNRVPKVDASSLEPASWERDPDLEWCPPGHGDLYTALAGSGKLDQLLAEGVKYAFVSNSDNLGATLDPRILGYFADSGLSFLMEVTARTAADRKGGHLARRKGDDRLVLRESAQCPDTDTASFQDISRHRFFNTNNLWIHLVDLKEKLAETGGFLPLPVIMNRKNVDPRDGDSPKVYQLETAMGAAIECFEKAGALAVSRERFAPVKTTSDLFSLRSDVYERTPDARLQLIASRNGAPPVIELDSDHYKMVDRLEEAIPAGPPSLLRCKKLKVSGPVRFEGGTAIEGEVVIVNADAESRKSLPAGTYGDETVDL